MTMTQEQIDANLRADAMIRFHQDVSGLEARGWTRLADGRNWAMHCKRAPTGAVTLRKTARLEFGVTSQQLVVPLGALDPVARELARA